MRERSPVSSDEVLRCIRAYIEEHHYSPSIRDIAQSLDRDVNVIHRRLLALRKSGLVEWQDGKSRTLRVIQQT